MFNQNIENTVNVFYFLYILSSLFLNYLRSGSESVKDNKLIFYFMFWLLTVAAGMEKYRYCQFSWSYQPFSWSNDVGDIISSSEKAFFRVILLHSSIIRSLCCLLGAACWWLCIQYGCWRNISFHTWSISAVLPIKKDSGCTFSLVPSMWNCGIGPIKTCK